MHMEKWAQHKCHAVSGTHDIIRENTNDKGLKPSSFRESLSDMPNVMLCMSYNTSKNQIWITQSNQEQGQKNWPGTP